FLNDRGSDGDSGPLAILAAFPASLTDGSEIHFADRTGPRLIAEHLRMHAAGPELCALVLSLRGIGSGLLHRNQIHLADRARSRLLSKHVGMHRAGPKLRRLRLREARSRQAEELVEALVHLVEIERIGEQFDREEHREVQDETAHHAGVAAPTPDDASDAGAHADSRSGDVHFAAVIFACGLFIHGSPLSRGRPSAAANAERAMT